jgi:hypothetical protein
METFTISNDIKGSNRPFFRDEFEEWIEFACEHRTEKELCESRYDQWQKEEFERLDEEGIDRSNMEW